MKTKAVIVKNLVTPSKLPSSDFVINSYIGCPHHCQYCYAEFMRRFTDHAGDVWGEFLDVKVPQTPINLAKLQGKSLVIGSVTDPYNPFENKYCATQKVLAELAAAATTDVTIITKSDLVTRDLALLQKIPRLTVAFSLNNTDENFRQLFEPGAPSSQRRIAAMQKLTAAGIHTALFISPIFPGLTDFKSLVEKTRPHASEFWFENLNLRGGYKPRILKLIAENYPALVPLYQQIYNAKDLSYWENLSQEIESYCRQNNITNYTNYFYHEKIRKN
jgi:DNA repair photolyase